MKYDLIIPIYNIQNELDNCLNSILHQTHSDFRAIMIDDGSTDQSSFIAKDYADKDSRFEYYWKENGGLSDARNFGITKILSNYVLFIDGDDFIEPNTLETIEKELLKNPVDVLEFNGWIIENGKKTRCINTYYIDPGLIKNGKDYILDNVKAKGMSVVVFLKVIRSTLILQHHHLFAKDMLHEDVLWTPKLYFLADTIKYIDKCLYNYVQRDGSITHQKNQDKNVRHAKKIFYQLENYYKNLDLTKHQLHILTSYLSRQMIWTCQITKGQNMTPEDKKFILRNAKDPISIGEMLLFFATPNQYESLINIIKKIVNY